MDQPIPDLTAVDTVSGDPLPPDTFEGSATVINVWANWCEPCRAGAACAPGHPGAVRGPGRAVRGHQLQRRSANWRARWVGRFRRHLPQPLRPARDGPRPCWTTRSCPTPTSSTAPARSATRSTARPTRHELSGLIDDVLAGDAAASSSLAEAGRGRRARRRRTAPRGTTIEYVNSRHDAFGSGRATAPAPGRRTPHRAPTAVVTVDRPHVADRRPAPASSPNSTREYRRIWRRVSALAPHHRAASARPPPRSRPRTASTSAQKCGGVHTNTIANSIHAGSARAPVTAAHPTSAGTAPGRAADHDVLRASSASATSCRRTRRRRSRTARGGGQHVHGRGQEEERERTQRGTRTPAPARASTRWAGSGRSRVRRMIWSMSRSRYMLMRWPTPPRACRRPASRGSARARACRAAARIMAGTVVISSRTMMRGFVSR